MTGHETIVRLEELDRMFDEGSFVFQVDKELPPVRVWPLFSGDTRVAVVRSVVPAGVTFPPHVHNEREIIICYAGAGTCTIINDERAAEVLHPLSPGKVVEIKPGDKHRITAFRDLLVVAVTVPAAPGFAE